jgi:hypothetical protein
MDGWMKLKGSSKAFGAPLRMSHLGSDQTCGVVAMGDTGLPDINGCFRLILHMQRRESVGPHSALSRL